MVQNFYEQLFYGTSPVASVNLFFLIKNNVGWFLVKSFVDLITVRYLRIISRNHSNTPLLINLQKTRKQKLVQSKALQQRLYVLILGF